MLRTSRWGCLFKGSEWFAGSVAVLFLLSAALALYAKQGQAHADMTGVLLALFVASWAYALGVAGLALLSVWLVVRAKTTCR